MDHSRTTLFCNPGCVSGTPGCWLPFRRSSHRSRGSCTSRWVREIHPFRRTVQKPGMIFDSPSNTNKQWVQPCLQSGLGPPSSALVVREADFAAVHNMSRQVIFSPGASLGSLMNFPRELALAGKRTGVEVESSQKETKTQTRVSLALSF